MAKFVIECPSCGKYTQASNFIFAKKKIDCSCGYKINVKTESLSSKECPHCKNNVVYDQKKGDKSICPVCKEKINTTQDLVNTVEITCPSCSCKLTTDKNADMYHCPLCDTSIDVQMQIEKEKLKNKGLANVIKYEGDNNTFVWKHPIEDFNLGSQLIVHESQEALFFRDGQALDLFGAGRHTLATQNLPLLENLYKLPTNADTIFHSEVYFINQTVQMGIKWGTPSKVPLFDPATGIHVELGASGEFSMRVCDSRKLVLKLVGTENTFTQADVNDGGYYVRPVVAKFKAMIITKVKSNLAKIIKENALNILELDEHIDMISEKLRDAMNPMLEEYGLTMPEFFVTTIMYPNDPDFLRAKRQYAEKYLSVKQEEILREKAKASALRQQVEAETAAKLKIIAAQGEAEAYKLKAAAEAEEMRMKGYTYQQETARQVGIGAVEAMAQNPGSTGGLGDVASLGISLGAVGGVMNMTKEALSGMTDTSTAIGSGLVGTITDTWDCTCGNKGIIGNFCNNCGAKKPANDTWDCTCGNKGINGNFCNNCGAKKPENNTWDCTCGNKGIIGNFCNNCGAKKPENNTWDCTCGNKGITGKFCNNCGAEKEEE